MSVVFAFGPDESYFMQTPHGSVWNDLPQHLVDHLQGRSEVEAIEEIYWMILAEDKTYRMGWRDCKGVDRMTLPDKSNNKRLSKFDDWANNVKYKHIMPRMKCALGSDDSFWASCNGSQRWNYIPRRAEEKLQAGRDPDLSDFPAKVKLVSLGYGHSYFIAFEDRTSSWKVKSNYKALDDIFEEEKKKAERVVCLAMNPFKRDQYFLIFDDGTSYWSLPKESEEQVAELAAKLKPKEGDIVRGTTKGPAAAPAGLVTSPAFPLAEQDSATDEKVYDNGSEPPAYTAGYGKIVVEEKETGKKEIKKSLKGRFRGNPSKWCKVM